MIAIAHESLNGSNIQKEETKKQHLLLCEEKIPALLRGLNAIRTYFMEGKVAA